MTVEEKERHNTNDRNPDVDRDEEEIIASYHLWSAEEIFNTLHRWKREYTDFIRITTAQDRYGLPPVGDSRDCSYERGGGERGVSEETGTTRTTSRANSSTTHESPRGCSTFIATIQDYSVYPSGSIQEKHLPHVLWIGEVHGDERVGPTAVMEAVDILLQASACEARVDDVYDDDVDRNKSHYDECRKRLRRNGIGDSERRWLARLLTTRRIVVLPTANAWGYVHNNRMEQGIDPNRDFPYDNLHPTMCMQTITARAINEVVRDHLFQLGIVFHAGADLLGYNWASYARAGWPSPDDSPFRMIAAAKANYAGSWVGFRQYPYGRTYRIIYPVNGGMEDWTYAASWDTTEVMRCQPTTYGGYPAYKTIYPNGTNRFLNLLVETSRQKAPSTYLGFPFDVLNPSSEYNGHIPRNLRVALMSVELVEPYVRFESIQNIPLNNADLVPLRDRNCDSHYRRKPIDYLPFVSEETPVLTVKWSVGGALLVNETDIWYGRWDTLHNVSCILQPSMEHIQTGLRKGVMIGPSYGNGLFSTHETTVFQGVLDLSDFQPGEVLVVWASARVDQSWADPGAQAYPLVVPQSHIVNVRTNPDWFHTNHKGDVVQGRLDWFSPPLSIVVPESRNNQAIPRGFAPSETSTAFRSPPGLPMPWVTSTTTNLLLVIWVFSCELFLFVIMMG